MFQCPQGKCISISSICDSVQQCEDGSDELRCPVISRNTFSHGSEQLSCTSYTNDTCNRWSICEYSSRSKESFPHNKICTFERNIYGHALYCNKTGHLQYCESHQCPNMFKCRHSYCIHFHSVCDEIEDCPDGEDEIECNEPRSYCKGLLKCRTDNICVHPTQQCDGIINCLYSEDDESVCSYAPCPHGCQLM